MSSRSKQVSLVYSNKRDVPFTLDGELITFEPEINQHGSQRVPALDVGMTYQIENGRVLEVIFTTGPFAHFRYDDQEGQSIVYAGVLLRTLRDGKAKFIEKRVKSTPEDLISKCVTGGIRIAATRKTVIYRCENCGKLDCVDKCSVCGSTNISEYRKV